MMCPSFQSVGISSCSQIFSKSGSSMSAVVPTSVLRASAGIPSGPAALPFFIFLTARMISSLVGGLRSISMSISASTVSGGFWGAGLLRISSKCSAHLSSSCSKSVMVCPGSEEKCKEGQERLYRQPGTRSRRCSLPRQHERPVHNNQEAGRQVQQTRTTGQRQARTGQTVVK